MSNKKIKVSRVMMSVMAAGMVASSAIPVMAAAPTGNDTATVTINNVEEAATVTAYRIVEPTYNANGFVKFGTVSGVTIANIEKPTGTEITTIAQSILNGTLKPSESVTLTKGTDNKTYTGKLKAGEYIVLVTDQESASYVYNPMVVSTYYTDANDNTKLVAASELNASGNFDGNVYAKKTTITLDKTILNADGNSGVDDDRTAFPNNGAQGDDLAVGDTGTFQISTKIPAYSDAYKAKGVQYTLTDTQDVGFDAPTDMVVKVGGQVVAAGTNTFTKTENGNDFTLDFASNFALAHAGQDVVVTYNAKLNANAKQKFETNNDTVKLTYTNDVYDKSHVDELSDDVQEYSFPVQVKKVGDKNAALSGAEFTLTRTDAGNKTGEKTIKVVTGKDGIAQFNHLDEGIYEVQETKAPAGYAINPDTFQIKITPEYSANGKLSNYKVAMVNKSQNNTAVGNITVSNADTDILAGNITDSKLQTLPSTGGEGTKMTIVLAAGLAGVTACVFVYGKKKEKAQ